TGEDLAMIFRILEQDELAARIGNLNGRFNATATVNADMREGTLSVPQLQADLLGADIGGNLEARGINGDVPSVSGTISASGPDLPTLIEVAGMLQGGRN